MTIPTVIYHEREMRAYAHQDYPTHHDPFAPGLRRFSSVVRIADAGDDSQHVERYLLPTGASTPSSAVAALDAVLAYGRDIIDGKIVAAPL
jgi:hypothetical protein